MQTSRAATADQPIHGGHGPALDFSGESVGHTGYIDWQRLARTRTWSAAGGNTFVYAFWLADYGRNTSDHGVGLLKGEGAHPDWFLYADNADKVLFSVLPDGLELSPNAVEVFDTTLTSAPIVASTLLGSAASTYVSSANQYWWAAHNDLTRAGKRLVKELSMLYLRAPVLVTFLEIQPMRQVVPGVSGDTATVTETPGQQPAAR